ncbi:MAG: AAA family ATPase [Alphaproteobacteria bacterium]|nr:AAA family ATPase [Alphaproteobacteria bacterium]
MYEEFFRFNAAPFRLNPDPKFFFGSRSHNKAMAYLHYGLRQAEGFIVITGEIGAGKSILIGHLIDQLDRSNVVAAHLLTANLEPSALLSHVLSAFRIEPSGQGKSAEIEAFEDFLFDQMNRGRRVLLIVDEAQNLPVKTIEELRMLSNMDYDGTPLFQVFLVGQPEFRDILAKPDMEQLRQRVIASYHLEPLGLEETTDYIRHRLTLVGWNNDPVISDDAFAAIFRATGGVPRKINKLCNRILLYCAIEKLHAIDVRVVETVESDLKSETLERAEDRESLESQREPKTEKREADESEAAREDVQALSRAAGGEGAGARRSAGPGARKAPAPQKSPVVIPFGAVRKPGGDQAQEAGEVRAEADAENATAAPASVFDRLRAQRAAEEALANAQPRTPATLIDVANAIAAASAAGAARKKTAAAGEETGAAASDMAGRHWRQIVAKAIIETREELKVAHTNADRLRRSLESRRARRRERCDAITAGLSRAETLLQELRDKTR